MSIELRCDGCGKLLKAPESTAGTRSKCPACGHEVYIPTPRDQIEELPLAPEDNAELQREAALLAERRRLDQIIARESAAEDPGPAGGSGSRPPESGGGSDVQTAVLGFLRAMRDSDLARADEWAALLRRQQAEAVRVVDRLIADQIPPPEMAAVPPGVYQGFLRNLRSRL